MRPSSLVRLCRLALLGLTMLAVRTLVRRPIICSALSATCRFRRSLCRWTLATLASVLLIRVRFSDRLALCFDRLKMCRLSWLSMSLLSASLLC